jgi:DNA-binding XRE family transcriptional regulator
MMSQRLKQLRTEAGLSQDSLGKKVGVSQQTIAGWEAGRTAPNRHFVSRLVGIFGVTSDYLLGISDHRTGPFQAGPSQAGPSQAGSFQAGPFQAGYLQAGTGPDGGAALDRAYLNMARILREEGITEDDLQALLKARDAFLKLNP